MDITHRGDFDAAVDKRFPNARRHRKETKTGFSDHFAMGFVHVEIRVCVTDQKGKRSPKAGQMVVEISGVRTAVDDSVTPYLWRRDAVGWGQSLAVLDELRMELLGIAHALSHICGRGPKPKKKQMIIPEDDTNWVDELFRSD